MFKAARVSRLRSNHSVVLAALAVSGLSFALSQTMLVPSLPDIEAAFGATPSEATTLMTAFWVSGAVTAACSAGLATCSASGA